MKNPEWQSGPFNRWSFQHVDEFVPSIRLPRGDGPVLDFVEAPLELGPDVDAFVDRSYTDGMIVLRGRDVLYERYLNGMTPTTRHLLQSVSKSMCSAVFGQSVADGAVSVDAPVSRYLSELTDSAYGDATVQQVLDMTVAVHYDEDYANPDSDVQTHERVGGWRPAREGDPADTYSYLATLAKSGEHGRAFYYCSANTDVLAWILERVTGRGFADILATDLWSRIGAEHDAVVTVDAVGFPMANGGMNVTLRDLARFGRVILDGGTGPTGQTVIPPGWIDDIRRGGDRVAAAASMGEVHPKGSYRNQFWISGDSHGCFYGIGIYGQYVWMDPSTDVVVAKVSSLPEADDDAVWAEHVAFFTQLTHEVLANK